jgi:glycosyl hydrolase family 2
LRKIEAAGGQALLNGEPLFLRLVLDQGYWPDGLMTAPSDEALRADIELAKAMGFNGARKHQKVEDPRWLYWADRLGFLVWGEMANAHRRSARYLERITAEWQSVIARDYNHPCVVAWVPLTSVLLTSPIVAGFCYTQLTDVEGEPNGLLTAGRTPKLALERIREIIGRAPAQSAR